MRRTGRGRVSHQTGRRRRVSLVSCPHPARCAIRRVRSSSGSGCSPTSKIRSRARRSWTPECAGSLAPSDHGRRLRGGDRRGGAQVGSARCARTPAGRSATSTSSLMMALRNWSRHRSGTWIGPDGFRGLCAVEGSDPPPRGGGAAGACAGREEPVWIMDVTRDDNFPRAKAAGTSASRGRLLFRC